MILNETYTLANGVQIPKLGLGTWFIDDDKAAGKVQGIGVSNFLRDDLENLLSACRVKPMVNQILCCTSATRT